MNSKISNLVYKWWHLYNKKPVSEKELQNKSLDELLIMKETERDYLSINIPIIVGILGIMFSLDDIIRKLCMFGLLVIFLVNIGVAHEDKKENISIYNKVILEKMEKKRKEEEEYKQQILKYLKR